MENETKNLEKYEAYKSMKSGLKRAMKDGFYYQAIFIEYAILEDRCESVLRHAGLNCVQSNGREITISEKLRKIRNTAPFQIPYVRKRISEELIEDIIAWKEERNQLIHRLAKIPYDHESVKNTAEQGEIIVKRLDNAVKVVNKYYDKMKEVEI